MTTFASGTRGDALRVQVGGDDVEQLAIVGTVRGVAPLAASARNGPGTGTLAFSPSPAPTLSWQAPGSSTAGDPVTVSADGDFLLEDGDDSSAWLRVRVATAWLPSSSESARVFLADRWNEAGPDDVTAADAAAGLVEAFELELVNASPDRVRNVKVWVDPFVAGLAISLDNATWVTPQSESDAAALAVSEIAVGGSVTLYLQRTTPAGASPSPSRLNLVQLAWDGL